MPPEMLAGQDFQGTFGRYQVRCTQDGSPTLWSEAFNETCHSMDGANGETDLYYVEGCRVLERGPTVPLFPLLEIGLGLGQGYERTILALQKQAPSTHLFYLAVERDEGLVTWGGEHYPSPLATSSLYPKRRDLRPFNFFGRRALKAETPQGTLMVLLGDGRQLLQDFPSSFQSFFLAIYQDAFSPKKNPQLWTVEWFQTLRGLAHPECILSTFSASSRIRKSLLQAGWPVQEGKSMGPKRSSTLGILNGKSQPSLLQRLEKSPVGALTDANCLLEWG